MKESAPNECEQLEREKLLETLSGDIPKESSATAIKSPQPRSSWIEVILKILSNNENQRLKQQRPLLFSIIALLAIQLLLFNGVVIAIVFSLWGTEDPNLLMGLFDFLKYYLGVVVAELVGMLFFVTKNSFSFNSQSVINGFLDSKNRPDEIKKNRKDKVNDDSINETSKDL